MNNGAERIFNWTLPPMAKFISSVFALWLDGQDEALNPEVGIIKEEIAIPSMVLYLRQRKISSPVQFANILLNTLPVSKSSFLRSYNRLATQISKSKTI